MYLMIFEDGIIRKIETVGEGDLVACTEGYVDIVDITDPIDPKSYYGNTWHPIIDAESGK